MHLGKYEILEELGRGGFGIVYKAHDTILDVPRAVKVLHAALVADSTFMSRFKQEARLAAKLDHPNIVPVYDYDEENGHFYLAMKYMPGGSLRTLLNSEGKIEEQEAVKIFEEICSGVSYIHKQGIIHRDLKLGNILFDADGSARICDMGFAKAMSGSGAASLSASGGMVGTPAYMAPEIWRGMSATPATDIYSLGCIFYEMLTGKVLFDGTTPADVLTKHVVDGPVFDGNIPERDMRILKKALAMEPANRYKTADELLEALALIDERPKMEPISTVIEPPNTAPAPYTPMPTPMQTPTPNPEPVSYTPPPTTGEYRPPQPSSKPAKAKLTWLPWAIFGVLAVVVLGLAAYLTDGFGLIKPQPGATQAINTENPAEVQNTQASVPAVSSGVENTPVVAVAQPTPLPEYFPTNDPVTGLGILSVNIRQKDQMVQMYIPAGRFKMGINEDRFKWLQSVWWCKDCSDKTYIDELPRHDVVLDSFWIDKYEVTNSQYSSCVSAGACTPPGQNTSKTRENYFQESQNYQFAEFPVVYVNYDQAAAYCAWVGGRLPTEAEWEKVARSLDGRQFTWGDEAPNDQMANIFNYVGDTTLVGSYPKGATVFGVMDIIGNVWEWVSDWYESGYYANSPLNNPTGPETGDMRILRGGSFQSKFVFSRTTERFPAEVDFSHPAVGFRCVNEP